MEIKKLQNFIDGEWVDSNGGLLLYCAIQLPIHGSFVVSPLRCRLRQYIYSETIPPDPDESIEIINANPYGNAASIYPINSGTC